MFIKLIVGIINLHRYTHVPEGSQPSCVEINKSTSKCYLAVYMIHSKTCIKLLNQILCAS